MDAETLERLRLLAKNKCKVTWEDDDTDARITEIVENAAEALKHKLGMKGMPDEVFLRPGLTRTIFENYCLYDWNNTINEFDKNYRIEILAQRHIYEVEQREKKE